MLHCGTPVVLVPLDVTRKLVFSPTDLLDLPAPESRTCRFLRQIVPFGIRASSNLYGIEGFHLKDVLGVIAAAQPGRLTFETVYVDVELKGELTRGMSVIDARPTPAGDAERPRRGRGGRGRRPRLHDADPRRRALIARIPAACRDAKRSVSSRRAEPRHAASNIPRAGVRRRRCADEDAPPVPTKQLGSLLREMVVAQMPTPLHEQDINWGHQKLVPVGVKWHKDGLLLKPEVQEKLHNDGLWRRIKVEAINPAKTFELSVDEAAAKDGGKFVLRMSAFMPVKVTFNQQLWKAGTRLYSGETRANCFIAVKIEGESTTRFVKGKSFLPDMIFRVRVTKADFSYQSLKVEHTLGVGGDLAKIFGEAMIDTVKVIKPSLETKLIEKANAAIVKAGDAKEIRVGVGSLFK